MGGRLLLVVLDHASRPHLLNVRILSELLTVLPPAEEIPTLVELTANGESPASGMWTVGATGKEAFPATRSLLECGVVDGTILYLQAAASATAVAAIESLTKEPEVGDTFTGKVVKTTQFGAFVELTKGTDGLLHVSNVGPGRVGHIEDVIERGDVLDVIVQEVDKARGRIGLKLVQKHENGGFVSPEELVERAQRAPPREREERPRRDDRRGGGGGRGGPRRDREGARSE